MKRPIWIQIFFPSPYQKSIKEKALKSGFTVTVDKTDRLFIVGTKNDLILFCRLLEYREDVTRGTFFRKSNV